MSRVALAMIVLLLGGCMSGVLAATIRDWFREADRRCSDWCELDVECGGEVRAPSVCVTACLASEDGRCADEHTALHVCEAPLACGEYRSRAAAAGACATERAAAATCDSQR